MSQRIGLEQVQSEQLLQNLTPQQLLNVRLTEMALADLEQRVKNEVMDNEALEEGRCERDDLYSDADYPYNGNDEDTSSEFDDDVLPEVTDVPIPVASYDYDPDDIPAMMQSRGCDEERDEIPIGDTVSFLHDLQDQMLDYDLDEKQAYLVEYLIGLLNNNGFIEQNLQVISDELFFNYSVDVTERELEEALHIVQQFEPAGIGARNYRECLLLQIDRKLADANISDEKERILRLERQIISDEYEAFENRNVERLCKRLSVNRAAILYAIEEIKKLNIRPGLALCESSSDRAQAIIPDFIVETDPDGDVSFRLNNGDLPVLHLSSTYRRIVEDYSGKTNKLSRHEREQFMYCKQKLDSAQMFIEAIKQRHNTLTTTMRAIISFQKQFFLTQDPDDLQTLIYKDVAEKAKLDISTISRVCKTKYALVDGHIYPLSYFFKHNRKNAHGEEIDSDAVASAILQIVEAEDKDHPLSDDQIVTALKQKFNILVARRTVNKYRADLAIPTAIKRKK